ncbi:MAG TPA: hypothetical protein PLZ08_07310 [Bacillota bacterium]|jgi:hypothetical protein|nr:hypothetical protein [Bacillota bacterium]HOL10003.1 hypothetical protein [Bacillota bacterium]HPO97752.1 hypothetical protein [Bacillota bacterium]
MILSETEHIICFAPVIQLFSTAQSILTFEIELGNVQFEIVGFSSAVVQISGEVVVNISFLGFDSLIHDQSEVIPFSVIEPIPGDFPETSTVSGSISLINQNIITEEDPSIGGITAITIFMNYLTQIIIKNLQ